MLVSILSLYYLLAIQERRMHAYHSTVEPVLTATCKEGHLSDLTCKFPM